MAGRTSEPGRSVSSRLLSILAAYRVGDGNGLTLAELSRRTGLTPATTHRLVHELREWGALERTPHNTYRIGLRLFELGMQADAHQRLRYLTLPYLQELYELTHENVHLVVMNQSNHLVFIEKISGLRSIPAAPRVSGGSLPIHATASGKVLLAHAGQEIVDQVACQRLSHFTPFTVRTPSALRQSLQKIREQGYAVCAEEARLGSVAIAAPVRDDTQTVIAALSVVGSSHRIDIPRVIAAVQANADSMSQRLSTVGPGPARQT